MNMLNSVIVEGIVKEVENFLDRSVSRVVIETDKSYRNDDGSVVDDLNEFPVLLYGRMAEKLHNWIKCGKQIRVVGRLKQDKWKDNKGKAHSAIVIVAEHVEIKTDDDVKEN